MKQIEINHHLLEAILCSNQNRVTVLYQITGGKKASFTTLEYSILVNSNDLEMQRYYYYLLSYVYTNIVFYNVWHMKQISNMLKAIDTRKKKLIKKKQRKI